MAVEGMGLVALDVVTALTIGLGGHYTEQDGGGLRYHPSGLEPELYLFSRTGYPYCAKSLGAAEPVGGYEPAICTEQAVALLRRDEHGGRRSMDARNQLLPLVLAEVELRYYTHAAGLDQGSGAADQVRDDLVAAWRAGTFASACSVYAQRYGRFSAAEHIFVGEGKSFADADAYQSDVYATVRDDVEEALAEGSPLKAISSAGGARQPDEDGTAEVVADLAPVQGPVARAVPEERASPRAKQAPVRVALVNNMPDGAFEQTERQWRALVTGWPGLAVEVECFTLPGVERNAAVARLITGGYSPLHELWKRSPDALVITGAEPRKAELTDELYWAELEKLLWWGRCAVPSMLMSCLTAHAAVWTFDRLPRRLLPEKCTGVFSQVLDNDHPLLAGVGSLSLPHSRFNEIPLRELEQVGYHVVAQSVGAGWTIATGERGQCKLLLLQGHPEYGRLDLLREYRRDVRRYLAGEQGSYPRVPLGYLDDEAAAVLEQFRAEATGRRGELGLIEHLPFDFAAEHVKVSWDAPGRAIIGNWLESVPAAAPGSQQGNAGAGPSLSAAPDGPLALQ